MIKKLQEFLPASCIEKIKTTKTARISLSFDLAEDLPLTQSKVGGRGYLSKEMPYPIDQNQKPLSLLAQINFAEMPALAHFPKAGLLSFYVNYHDDLLGLDFDDPVVQKGFRVIYTEDFTAESYTKEEQDMLFEQTIDVDNFDPVVPKEAKVIAEIEEQLLLIDSFDFEKAYGTNSYVLLGELIKDKEQRHAIFDLVYEESSQIGGYPFFTQEDPRYTMQRQHYDTLLFQLASDQIAEQIDIMWGDCGVGNFFINQKDLLNRDFSKVMYNWDCS